MQQYGLIGHPLGHSFSAAFFAEKFAREHIDARYENFDLAEVNDLRDWVSAHPELVGFNVTIPHKQTIVAQLDALSPAATEVGAVNVVRCVRSAEGKVRLLGDNSDCVGFTESLRPLLRPDIQHALVLGTGGASRAVVVALRHLGISPTYVSRYAKSEGVKVGGQSVSVLTYDELTPEVMKSHLRWGCIRWYKLHHRYLMHNSPPPIFCMIWSTIHYKRNLCNSVLLKEQL